jgi:effector-binding domain-containing protein
MLHRRLVILGVAALCAAHPARLLAQTAVQTQPVDPFGLEVALTDKPILYISGTGEWDTAYETLVEAFKSLQVYLDKSGIKSTAPAMTIYTAMDDVSFNFQAAIPVAAAPTNPPQGNIGAGTSPAGKMLKFVHRGSFETMAMTYDAISHYVEEKQLSTKELLVEEYVTDFVSSPPDKLVINIFVPLN